jgi:hypothetical protein
MYQTHRNIEPPYPMLSVDDRNNTLEVVGQYHNVKMFPDFVHKINLIITDVPLNATVVEHS